MLLIQLLLNGLVLGQLIIGGLQILFHVKLFIEFFSLCLGSHSSLDLPSQLLFMLF